MGKIRWKHKKRIYRLNTQKNVLNIKIAGEVGLTLHNALLKETYGGS